MEYDYYFKNLIDLHYISSQQVYPIYDGPGSKYFEARLRILWILKEPYDSDGGGWSINGLMSENPKALVHARCWPTWHTIVYHTFSILNGFPSWDEMDYIRSNPRMMDCLQSISYINISKLPGKTRSNWNLIDAAYARYRHVILEQIEILNPHIIICGGTMTHMWRDLIDMGRVKAVSFNGCESFQNAERLILAAKHPSYRVNFSYRLDSVIKIAKEWCSIYQS